MIGPKFFSIPRSIARIPQAELSFGAKCLYGRLDLYGRKTGKRNPSQKTLAKELGVSERHIRNLLAELQNCGLLSWVRTRGSASYTLNPPEAFKAKRNCASCLERNHSSGPDRKSSSDQTGTRVPTTRCSSKDHHQKRSTEKKQHAHAKESEPNPTFESDDEKTRTPLASPEMEFRARMAERHGPGVDAEMLLREIKSDLGDVTLLEFLDADLKATTAPHKLTNPAGHYRRLAQKLAKAKGISAVEVAMETAARARASVVVNERQYVPPCSACKDGALDGGGYCSCRVGEERRKLDALRAKPAELAAAPLQSLRVSRV